MSSAEEGSLAGSRARRTDAIAIPNSDTDEYDDTTCAETPSQSGQFFAASPGAGSYVAGSESWRPVPPPMLASSLDARFRPSLKAAASEAREDAITPCGSSSLSQHSSYGTLGPGSASDALPTVPAAVVQMKRKEKRARRRHRPRPDVSRRSPNMRDRLARVFLQVRQLNECPRELWLIFAMKFLSSYAYFSFSLILTTFLTEEFGMSDSTAGWAYGAYGVMSTFFGLVCGWLIDFLGVRASLLVGALIGALSRFIMAFTMSSRMAIIMLYTLLPLAESLGIPIMTIGIKRYTNATNRTFAFSLFYSMMNVAALCAGPLVDASRYFFSNGFETEIHFAGYSMDVRLTSLRLVVLSSAIATAMMCIVVVVGIREIEVDESGNLAEFTPNRDSPMAQTAAVLREPAFWRLTLFTLLLVGVRLVFRHLDATMPKYLTRQFGPNAPFGLVYAINPFLIIFLVPIVGLLTRKIDSFSMILYGSVVSAASPFWLCFQQTYFNVIMFMVTLSLGEAVYSPRVYEYTMEVSGRGAEGLYSSLSSAPLFSVKLLVGGMSGWLLTSFMPVDGPHHGAILWGIVGLTSMTSPVLMWILREYISPSEPEPTDVGAVTVPTKGTAKQLLVTAARPPTGKSTSVTVNIGSDEDDEYDSDGEEDLAGSSSMLGQSPLSRPPMSGSHTAIIAPPATQSPAGGVDDDG